MTPKEKAKELVYKTFGCKKYYAKLAVDEIIDECGNWTGGTNDGWDTKRFDYWQEVKKEIEKL